MSYRVLRGKTATATSGDEKTINTRVERGLHNSSTESTKSQYRDNKRKGDNLENIATVPVTKYQKFELESHEKLNSCDFPMELPSFVNRYVTTHKREEEITEKIFVKNPLPNNMKVPIKSDEHLQEILQKTPEKHKLLDLKKIFKGIQDIAEAYLEQRQISDLIVDVRLDSKYAFAKQYFP